MAYNNTDVVSNQSQSSLDDKLLDARQPNTYQHNTDVLNQCFGPVYLGKTYNAWMKGSFLFDKDGEHYVVWFPKLVVKGKAASKSGWKNTISPDGKTIEETGGKKRFDPSNRIIFVFAKEGTKPYCFRGVFKFDKERSKEQCNYYNKIADVADLRESVPLIHLIADEREIDDLLVAEIRNEDSLNEDSFVPVGSFEYNGKPVAVPELKQVQGKMIYPRNKQKSLNALAHAGYVCEIDPGHITFKRKNTGLPYTEPHHLVPMAEQYRFNNSLDVEENIVSLCSNCHNHIHYGQGAEELLKKLYNKRKDKLVSAGIDVTEEELLTFYK